MASPGNRHCANCIGTLSLPITAGQCRLHATGDVDWLHCAQQFCSVDLWSAAVFYSAHFYFGAWEFFLSVSSVQRIRGFLK